MTSNCKHEQWTAYIAVIADGRETLREKCVKCGATNGGTNLGVAIPMVADVDLVANSFKYHGRTMGHIAMVDKPYLRWLVTKSKVSSRYKNAAARLYFNEPYTPPREGDIYSADKTYNVALTRELRESLEKYVPTHPESNPK